MKKKAVRECSPFLHHSKNHSISHFLQGCLHAFAKASQSIDHFSQKHIKQIRNNALSAQKQ
jgi:hypothetical protein